MNIKMNILDYPIDINSENDSIVLTTQGGEQKNNGRISGYSAGELIDPAIEDSGFFEWKDPEYNINGSVFVSPKLLKSVEVLNTGRIGLFDEVAPAADYFTENLVVAGSKIYKNQQYVALLGNVDTAPNDLEVISDSGTKITVINSVWSSTYPASYLLQEYNDKSIYMGGANCEVIIEFPVTAAVSGVYLVTRTSYNPYDFKLEYSKDGETWESYGPIEKLSNDSYTLFEDLDMDPTSDVEGLTFFSEPLTVKKFRLTVNSTGTSTQSLLCLIPFMDLANQVVNSNLIYEDVRLDPNSFELDEAEQALTLSRVPVLDSFDVTNSKSLERTLWLKDDEPVNLKYDKILSFNKANEFLPGLNATLEHSISGGGMKLEGGVYEAELEVEYYASDYRLWEEGAYNFPIEQENYIYLIDAVRNLRLTDYRYIANGHFKPNPDVVTYIADGHLTDEEKSKWLTYPQPPSTANTVLGHYETESVLQVDIDHKTAIKADGLTAIVGITQKTPYWVKVEASDGSNGWNVVLDWYNHTDFTNVFKVNFPETTAKAFRISFRHVEPGNPIGRHYVSVTRLFLNYVEDSNVLKYMQKFMFRFAIHDGTTIAAIAESTSNGGIVRDRTLKLSKLGPYSAREAFYHVEERQSWMDEPDKQQFDGSKFLQTPRAVISDFGLKVINGRGVSASDFSIHSPTSSDKIVFNVTAPVVLYRTGSRSMGPRKSAPVKLFKLGAENLDISHLSFDPIKRALGAGGGEGLTAYPGDYRGDWAASMSDNQGANNLFNGPDSVHLTRYFGTGFVYLTLDFDNPIAVKGIFETLSSTHPTWNGYLTAGPRRITAEYYDDDIEDWVELHNKDDVDENLAVISEQYQMSLDGTERNGASPFTSTERIIGDDKRRYYGFRSEVTAKQWRLGIQGVERIRRICLRELGLWTDDGTTEFDKLATNEEWKRQSTYLNPFTEVLPPGTYQIQGALDERIDSAMFFVSPGDGAIIPEIKNRLIHYPYESRVAVSTVRGPNIGDTTLLTDGKADTRWTSDYAGSGTVSLGFTFGELIDLNGIYETLATDLEEAMGKVFNGPKRVSVFTSEDGDVWSEVLGAVNNDVIGAADEMSLNGTARSGATDFDDGTVNVSDGIRRYYAFAEPIKTKHVKIEIENGTGGKFLVANELGLFYTDGTTDFTAL